VLGSVQLWEVRSCYLSPLFLPRMLTGLRHRGCPQSCVQAMRSVKWTVRKTPSCHLHGSQANAQRAQPCCKWALKGASQGDLATDTGHARTDTKRSTMECFPQEHMQLVVWHNECTLFSDTNGRARGMLTSVSLPQLAPAAAQTTQSCPAGTWRPGR
jgi:hypothetical protein